jgi:hypothetical protein
MTWLNSKWKGDLATMAANSLSHGERVGVRGYDPSFVENPSPESQERSDLSLWER